MDLRDVPIGRPVLPHTGRLDGDDTGYRDVAVDPEDSERPDPLVPLPASLARCAVYAVGSPARVSPYYPSGLGASPLMLLRAPALAALLEADARLASRDRRVFVLDAWRSADVQAGLWAHVFSRLLAAERKNVEALSVADWLRLGRAADDTASFCRLLRDARVDDAVQALINRHSAALAACGPDLQVCATELLTYKANWGSVHLPLDEQANTAHGSGGACDVILADADGPTNIGVPFDSTSPAAVVDWFEHAEADQYRDVVMRDPGIRAYLEAFAVAPADIDADLMARIRAERRLLFHAMNAVGASYFSLAEDQGEAWHFNFGNERGGRQADRLRGAGNACHSMLRDIRDPATGVWTAAWGNAAAHVMARETMAASSRA